ncbi:flavodoxin family protein [Actinotalea subterranea]|uniref:flavodoxin family protein n=1 Tax=Actinotalea subterranea TaxID=2607497 RepID=UPI0011EC08C9|nr:flavodoxin family protein [Actinotalea subterranea]
MSTVVVYESMYGSTKAIAEAVADGLAAHGPVRLAEVSALAATPGSKQLPADVDLVVLGGPTHAFSMSRASTRQDAVKDSPNGAVISAGKGLREWIEALRLPTGGLQFAAFDTKVVKPNLPGSAAKAADKAMRALGGRPIAKPRTFKVHGKADGLVDGEVEAARAWGRELGAAHVRV